VDYLNDAEKSYLKGNFTAYNFDFPKNGGNDRPHALAAISRNMLEKYLIYKLGADNILDIGSNFARHFFNHTTGTNGSKTHTPREIYCVNYDNNLSDIARNDERILKIQTHPAGNEWLQRHVQFIRNEAKFGAPVEGRHIGLMIHALYDSDPQSLYDLMVNYDLRFLYATMNKYSEGGKMYCDTMQWRKRGSLYVQEDIAEHTSIYTHQQDPNQWEKMAKISGELFSIKVEVWSDFGDQRVYKFTKVSNDRIATDFDRKQPVYDSTREDIIIIPELAGYNNGVPIMKYVEKPFKPNKIATRRISAMLLTDHPQELDVYQYCIDYLNKMNNKAVSLDGKLTIKIDFDAQDIMENAAYLTHIHRKNVPVYTMLSQKSHYSKRPVQLMSMYERICYFLVYFLFLNIIQFFRPYNQFNFQSPYSTRRKPTNSRSQHSPHFDMESREVIKQECNLELQVEDQILPATPNDILQPHIHKSSDNNDLNGRNEYKIKPAEINNNPENIQPDPSHLIRDVKDAVFDVSYSIIKGTVEVASRVRDVIVIEKEAELNMQDMEDLAPTDFHQRSSIHLAFRWMTYILMFFLVSKLCLMIKLFLTKCTDIALTMSVIVIMFLIKGVIICTMGFSLILMILLLTRIISRQLKLRTELYLSEATENFNLTWEAYLNHPFLYKRCLAWAIKKFISTMINRCLGLLQKETCWSRMSLLTILWLNAIPLVLSSIPFTLMASWTLVMDLIILTDRILI
jgi:hypothetical protein